MPLTGDARAESSVQTAEAAALYAPAPGERLGPFLPVAEPGPRLSPMPAADLAALKAGTGDAAAAAALDTVIDGDDGAARARRVFKNCATNIPTGSAPPDIHGAAGRTNLVVVTNRDIGIYNRSSCAVVLREPLSTFFSKNGGFTIPATESLFDPRVLYDSAANRCMVVVESRNSGNTDQFLYVAGSTNSACTKWRRVRFALSRDTNTFCKRAAADFYDYPNVGYNKRRLVVTANNFATSSVYGSIISIDKTALLATGTVRARCFTTTETNLAPSIVGDTSSTMYILSPGSGLGNSVDRFRLVTSAGGTGGDTLTKTASIAIPAWTAAPDAAQPNGQVVDSLDGRFQSASKQIGTRLWNVHTIRVGNFARFRLYRFSTTGTSASLILTPTTASCRGADHLFNPSVDTASASKSALAFVTASRTCPGNATAGRVAHLAFRGGNASTSGWTFNTVATSTSEFTNDGFGNACNNTARGSCRWGDYSSTQIDPLNTGRAWSFNQLVAGATQFDWATRGALVGP